MTPDQAGELANTIVRTWPHGKLDAAVWREAIERYDVDTARRTYEALRDACEYAPTIAAFIAKHRELNTGHVERYHEPCDRCGNTGWESRKQAIHGHVYDVVRPCSCTRGAENNSAHQRIAKPLEGTDHAGR